MEDHIFIMLADHEALRIFLPPHNAGAAGKYSCLLIFSRMMEIQTYNLLFLKKTSLCSEPLSLQQSP